MSKSVIFVQHSLFKPHKIIYSQTGHFAIFNPDILATCALLIHCDFSFVHPDALVSLCSLTLVLVFFSGTNSWLFSVGQFSTCLMLITVQRPNTDTPL